MPSHHFEIPAELSGKLRVVDSLDSRSDEEILKDAGKFIPVTNERNIWTFWHSGVQNMPRWTQQNVANWSRLNGTSWTIRVLDAVPDSDNYALKYIDKSCLPDCFLDGTMDGPNTGPHAADMLRTVMLWKYGGVWIDVGCIAVRRFEDMCWRQLEDQNSPFEVSVPFMFELHMANHFVASRKGSPFIKAWHDFFVHLWKGRTNSSGILNTPLLAYIKDMSPASAKANGYEWEFHGDPAAVFEYITQILCWARICMLVEPNGGFNGADYYANRILLFDARLEDWSAETLIGWHGQDLFDVLATPLSCDKDSEKYKKAYKTVWHILTKGSMQKVTHGAKVAKTDQLGTLLDRNDSNRHAGEGNGTFMDLLRYGGVHFEQVGREMEYRKAVKPEKLIEEPLLG